MKVKGRTHTRAVSGIMPLLDVLFILLFSLLALSDAKQVETEAQEEVRIELPGDTVAFGTAVDIDADGRIVVEAADGTTTSYDVGDVVHLRPDRAGPAHV